MSEAGSVSEEKSRYSTRTATWGRQKEAEPQPAPVPQDNQGIDFWDDDDASPVAPDHREDRLPGESTWARIRRQSRMGVSQQPQQRQNAAARPGQSSSQPVPVTGNHGERDQAQAEFDRMLDQERKMSTDAFQGSQQKNGHWWGKWD
ncbi:putative endo-1,3(4)-beta-glucanase [Aspergillus ibericus CBS 121593]|uniref:Uncharacterized protein n=1 Tax=Aspergillus ibericus CBS 121593 TaxID=1448316 RepID=A0A395GI17_9EURO|nr:hypothetical protein BO80DRAFT_430231 [Aspergillus ibericus CBS 121593]RAK95050.1 hypothetical protein BO80DRAFT_430231 [Aspergillus ibericus CBS 121593]